MMFHWKYADERSLAEGQVGWYVTQIANPDQAAQVVARDRPASSPTRRTRPRPTPSRRSQASFASMFGNLNLLLGSVALAVVHHDAVRRRQHDGDVGARADDRDRGDADARLPVGDDLPARRRRGAADGAGRRRRSARRSRASIVNAEFLGMAGGFIPAFGVNNRQRGRRRSASASLIGLLAAVIPATMASRLKIVDALRRVA